MLCQMTHHFIILLVVIYKLWKEVYGIKLLNNMGLWVLEQHLEFIYRMQMKMVGLLIKQIFVWMILQLLAQVKNIIKFKNKGSGNWFLATNDIEIILSVEDLSYENSG